MSARAFMSTKIDQIAIIDLSTLCIYYRFRYQDARDWHDARRAVMEAAQDLASQEGETVEVYSCDLCLLEQVMPEVQL